MNKFYQFISWIIYPFIIILLSFRVFKGKENKLRYKEKLGYSTISRPDGKLIWFHAASIGEFNAILPIIKMICEKFNHSVLVTTVTLTAATIAHNNLPKNSFHQFMPLDSIIIVRRFLKYWRPDLVIWTESEIWPNMLLQCKAIKLLVNARISNSSFRIWKKFKNFSKMIFAQFDLILAQSEETKNYLEQLGGENILYLGNLKYVASQFDFDPNKLEALIKQVENRKIILGASTHAKEEAMLKEVHLKLKAKFPNLLTIIAPRHPQRIQEVINDLEGLHLAFRSQNHEITKDTDIFIVDTLGELGIFYRLSKVVCIGGSWKRIAHSFLEPAKLGNLIIFGPNYSNSKEVSELFLNEKAAILAKDVDEIANYIDNFFSHPVDFGSYVNKSMEIVEEMFQVKEKISKKILPFIERL